MKHRVIESVEVIHQHLSGPDIFRLGGFVSGVKIADITEYEGNYQIWDAEDEVIVEIKRCPVVVKYRDAEEGE